MIVTLCAVIARLVVYWDPLMTSVTIIVVKYHRGCWEERMELIRTKLKLSGRSTGTEARRELCRTFLHHNPTAAPVLVATKTWYKFNQ